MAPEIGVCRTGQRLPPRRMPRLSTQLVLALAAVAAMTAAAAPRGSPPPQPPLHLSETGLYVDATTRAVDPRNLPYSPQYPLWSDGADKSRWIFLPPGTAIDARDPESWVFPIGTKLWKEFSWRGKRVETRLLQRTRAGWTYSTYEWNEAGSDADLVPADGAPSRHLLAPGRPHLIPSVADCKDCHENGRSEVLGFSALQLSPDRDPLAPHAEPLRPGDLTLTALVERRLLRGLPLAVSGTAPRIAAASPRGRAALGYLHANCGICHHPAAPLASIGLFLRHSLSAHDPSKEPAAGAIGHPSAYGSPPPTGNLFWIAAGDPDRSAVVTRMASRSPAAQMPPLGTQLVDEDAVALLTAWIREDLPPDR